MASHATRDHEEIRRWANEHQACPSVVSRTAGMLRFDFRDSGPMPASDWPMVDWDDFFSVFDEKGLELIYDDKPGSRFHKLAFPETIAARGPKRGAHPHLKPVAPAANPPRRAFQRRTASPVPALAPTRAPNHAKSNRKQAPNPVAAANASAKSKRKASPAANAAPQRRRAA